jgi:hypothetical protein
MAKVKDFYRVVPGGSLARTGSPSGTVGDGDSAIDPGYMNYSWYHTAVKGVQARMQKYKLYNEMDRDTDIARSLDTLADEMSPSEADNMALPFEIQFNIRDDEEVDEVVVSTLKESLNRFCSFHKLDVRLWQICRQTVKYGDCFFQKMKRKADGKTIWRYIDQDFITGILLDRESREPVYYQMKLEEPAKSQHGAIKEQVYLPKTKVIHFSLGSDMNKTAPFGRSVLDPIYRTYRQLSLLEDSVIIYRIVRAPERRIFYVDVGKMSPMKSKQYIERLKTELRQKRIPSQGGSLSGTGSSSGMTKVDAIYNPASMLEDFYIPQTADGRGSRVESLAGGQNLGELEDLHYFQDKLFRGLKIPLAWMVNGRSDQGGQSNDGRVGTAYIAELRFVRHIMRLQEFIDHIFDKEFKDYLKENGIQIDENLFTLKLPEPQNFAVYREAELQAQLFTNFGSAQDIGYFSKRFIMGHFLKFTQADIQTNEALLRQERGIPKGGKEIPIKDPVTGDIGTETEKISDLQLIYDPKQQGDNF